MTHTLLVPQFSLQSFASHTIARLVLAAVLGGAIGLDRELKHRPAGLRTNMFICFGSAMFTILSADLAGEFTGDHTRIAAQIIPGIGFIGAGSIMHSKGGTTIGLTTAATIFVVASVGMACGGGLFLPALFATLLILLALQVLGRLENRLSLKRVSIQYSLASEKPTEDIVGEVNSALDDAKLEMQTMRLSKVNETSKMTFTVDATREQHDKLRDRLHKLSGLHEFEALPEAGQ